MQADLKSKFSQSDSGPLAVLRLFFWYKPLRFVSVLVVVLAAGIVEGIGILTLLPVIVITTGNIASGSVIAGYVQTALSTLGIPASLGFLLTITVVAVSGTAALRLLANQISGYASIEFAAELRLALVRAFIEARWLYFIRQSTGRLSNAVMNEANLAGSLYSAVISLVATAIQVLMYLVLATFASWQMTVAGILFGLLMVGSLHGLVQLTRRAGKRQVNAMNSLMSRVVEGLQLIKPLKAMAREDRLAPLLQSDTQDLKVAQRRLMLTTAALGLVQEPIFALFLAIGLYGAVTWLNYPISDLLFMAVLFQRIVSRIGHMQVLHQKAVGFESSYHSVCEVLAQAEAASEPSAGGTVKPKLENAIELQNVNFSYDTTPVLQEVSFEIPAGGITSIIGPSGAGKSTLIDLLLGLSPPDSGRILIDGVPLDRLDLRAWRKMIGYVPQEVVLWHDTIANNVSLRDPKLSPQDIEAALRAAGAWGFVSELPEGLDTMVGERGMRFSGGQRQRISIARALVRKPRLLVLDEPTTALDPEAEQAICRTLRDLSRQATVLAISHQAGIVGASDRVYRLDEGRISEVVTINDAISAPLIPERRA
jgi:ATP-binding cassette subfamily C protein